MPKRAVLERSRRELSLDVSVGVHIILVVEQSSLGSQSRGFAKTPVLTVVAIFYISMLFLRPSFSRFLSINSYLFLVFSIFLCVCACVPIFFRLHMTAQSGSVILIILCLLALVLPIGGINDTCYEKL